MTFLIIVASAMGRESKDGVLLLIDMDNREVAITTTGEAQYSIRQSQMDAILDEMRQSSRRAIMPERWRHLLSASAMSWLSMRPTGMERRFRRVMPPPSHTCRFFRQHRQLAAAHPLIAAAIARGGDRCAHVYSAYRRHRPVQPASEAALYTVPNSFRLPGRRMCSCVRV